MAAPSDDSVVIIKKYANRRLYNTESSSYITLEHLAEMVRKKREFRVVDAKSGEDITHSVLTQIIVEEEARGETMLPVNFLRQLIAMYGNSMQAMVPQYLEASLEAFQRNQSQLSDVMAGAFSSGPLAEMAKRNMEMFAAAARGVEPAKKKSEPKEDTKMELQELKAQLAELQKKLDQLGG
ncbi:MAG TPA: polyhydroxyalkanoate synthesis repressor PhaR [Allosphingosinicella sp.]|uniref:polyhydroxyalkanoate synthesis repressor PhaR n=1 Tax=Allosphingosinicella sp. TaxID=2823234 RepID=UPI002ED96978